ncbi:tmRNA-binding protein SmpB [invertebrate metagenome]|uniref:TmRNA-binding protein SmpB n=1 Tax=invertebrate metagenome TaxID=1711999 RepID=A0A484H7E3_9ZZZZ
MSRKRNGGVKFISHGTVSENRRARYEYSIESAIDAGLVLVGSEVKSLRLGRCTITECYAGLQKNEFYLFNAYIPEYQGGANLHFGHEARRPRKLLLHRREIRRLYGVIARSGMTLVPLVVYFNNRGLAKVRLGLARGRKLMDKRDLKKKRDWQREKARVLRDKNHY